MKTFLSLTAMMFAVLCLNLSQTSGQDYDISEDTLDFGGVQIGSSATDVITITNNNAVFNINVIGYSFINNTDNVFSIPGADIVGAGISSGGGSLDVEVEFTRQLTITTRLNWRL